MTTPRFTMRRTGAIVLCLAAAMFAASCGGNASKKKSADGATETQQTETTAPKGVKVADIPNDKINALSWDSSDEKEAVIAEIPAELLKIVGEVRHVTIQNSTFDGWKYLVNIQGAKSADAKADLEKQIEYYKGIGATVEKSTALLTDYDVKFGYAESTDVSATQSYMTLRFNVIKK